MSWSDGKKKISLEKSIAMARQRLVPLWHSLKPLLWMDGATLRVLEPEFTQLIWVVYAMDPLRADQQELAARFEKFRGRYRRVDLSFLLVVPVPVGSVELPAHVKEWISKTHFREPLVADPEGGLLKGLSCPALPYSLSVFKGGKSVMQWNGEEPLSRFELKFQDWLRSEDPGLPLVDPDLADSWPVRA
ncbi:MAG: hypothetical protein ACK5QT_02225 [Oligoflexia bacterium]|jgi:hypothetical protein